MAKNNKMDFQNGPKKENTKPEAWKRGIMGMCELTAVASIVYSSVNIINFTNGDIYALICIAPQVFFALGILINAFIIKRSK